MTHRAWVKDAATEIARVQLADATRRRMPNIGDGSVRAWQVLDEHGSELPMFVFFRVGSQSYPGRADLLV